MIVVAIQSIEIKGRDIPRSQKQHFQNTGFWGKERLTASERTFAVPVAIEKGNTLTVGEGSPLSRMKIYSTPGIAPTSVAAQSCKDVTQALPGLTKSDLITGIMPPKSLGNLSLNAYASAADTLTLHFCNPTASSVSIPSGAYSFPSVH